MYLVDHVVSFVWIPASTASTWLCECIERDLFDVTFDLLAQKYL